jgi:hypothetical protein
MNSSINRNRDDDDGDTDPCWMPIMRQRRSFCANAAHSSSMHASDSRHAFIRSFDYGGERGCLRFSFYFFAIATLLAQSASHPMQKEKNKTKVNKIQSTPNQQRHRHRTSISLSPPPPPSWHTCCRWPSTERRASNSPSDSLRIDSNRSRLNERSEMIDRSMNETADANVSVCKCSLLDLS